MSWIDILSMVVALGASLIGGTFFAFSNFVMPGIARQPAASGIATMNAINVTVLNAGFLGAFMGTAILGLAWCSPCWWRAAACGRRRGHWSTSSARSA